ncbi:hypothetical protein BGZ51_001727 [Haplosporangium sp. Z 767]|nr:hypothetical protein BGZ51_001727 [Haplosporangium sp. Z 767]
MESAAIRNEENTRVIAGAQRLYEQIGRLTELEVLRLDSGQGMLFVQDYDMEGFSWDLTLSRGYLRKLSGLKKLRKLSLMEDFYSRMGQAEVEFIDAEWPRLELIEFKWKLSRISSTPPWRWLKERRPGLRYKEI